MRHAKQFLGTFLRKQLNGINKLIAAIVSARFSRSKNAGRMIIAGVSVGFMLYVVMKIAWDLGSGGVVPPPLAAWLPAIIATLVGLTVLLHLEDG